jgi:hypothetical protein
MREESGKFFYKAVATAESESIADRKRVDHG